MKLKKGTKAYHYFVNYPGIITQIARGFMKPMLATFGTALWLRKVQRC